jgi:hypothetical protein
MVKWKLRGTPRNEGLDEKPETGGFAENCQEVNDI